MEFSLESPGSSHFTAPEDNQDTWKRDKRRKNPSTLRRDKKRAEQRRAQAAGPVPGAGPAQHAVEEHERQIKTGRSPLTRIILPLVPRPGKVRRKRRKSVKTVAKFLNRTICMNWRFTEQSL